MYIILCGNAFTLVLHKALYSVIHKAVMYCMTHDCFYPALDLFLAMRVTYMILILIKIRRSIRFILKRVLNHFVIQGQNDRKML